MNTLAPLVLPLDAVGASLELVGGKGRSLAVLAAAKLPVPCGFLLTTDAYKDFVEANALQASILEIVADVSTGQVAGAERASAKIEPLFREATIPEATAVAIVQAYEALGEETLAVAVRSSATAEDLPELSFAGQQDTYLNVRGQVSLLDAVRRCWASLWTARAIGYRAQMNIDQHAVAMGVVVQVMVPAEVSGILFTANPATGERSEIVINASFGLGEAIVGGHVTPDTYVLDRDSFACKQTIIGSKEKMIVSTAGQGTEMQAVPDGKREESSLSTEILSELAALSLQVEQYFGGLPQDIEWAVADGHCWLLQSRPITNLPAAPLRDVRWEPPFEGAKLIRRQVVENMPDPLSPLFAELYLQDGLQHAIEQMLNDYEMPFAIEDFIKGPMFVTANGYAYCRADYQLNWQILRIMPKAVLWTARFMPRFFRDAVPAWRDEGLPEYLKLINEWKELDVATASGENLFSGIRVLTKADAIYWFRVTMVMGLAKMTDGLLHLFLTSRAVKGDLISGMFLRGFPSKTLQAQEELESIANRVRGTPVLHELVMSTRPIELLETLRTDTLGRNVAEEIDSYLDRYGHQIYTLDFAQPTQIEDPLPVLLSLRALVENAGYDTSARHAEMAKERETLVIETMQRLGPVRRWLFKKFLGWAQKFGPHREEALFYMGAAWPTLRQLALELGRRLVDRQVLDAPDDVFYLHADEIDDANSSLNGEGTPPDFRQVVAERRALREAQGRLHPPPMVPEKERFKIGPFDMSYFETQKRNVEHSDTLNGFAVSPGQVTGLATVILSPADFHNMQADTILVCPTTTPAWTPLFAQALALVTDIGGILAHGSIVAREYGIPAVMGTGNITQRIVSGQRITVDGDLGIVTIIE